RVRTEEAQVAVVPGALRRVVFELVAARAPVRSLAPDHVRRQLRKAELQQGDLGVHERHLNAYVGTLAQPRGVNQRIADEGVADGSAEDHVAGIAKEELQLEAVRQERVAYRFIHGATASV